MEFQNVKDISIYGTDCIADVSRGDDDVCRFVSAKEKYFDVQADGNSQLTVTQKTGNIFYRIIMRRFEFKLILPKNFKGRLRFRNKNGGLYISDGDFTDVELSTKNGKFEIEKISCGGFSLKMRNGDVNIKNMTASKEAAVKCKNSNIKIEAVAAPTFSVSCKNAILLSAIDVKSDKFECSTKNGAIDANAIDAADLRLETNNGKINVMTDGVRNECRLSLETTHGTITVDGAPSKNVADAPSPSDKKHIAARTSNGDIDIRFV